MDLHVSFFAQPCGVLSIEDERFTFRYLDEYVASAGQPISVCMPVRDQIYTDRVVFPFFENLLPEGEIRTLLAARLKTSDNSFARLLDATGGDVAGALSISAAPFTEGIYTKTAAYIETPPLSKEALGQLLQLIETTPFLSAPGSPLRLSLAGAQRKLPIILANNGICAPDSRLSTHIVKPPSPRFAHLVENEYLCMRTARRAGINVPDVTLVPFVNNGGEEYDCYVVRRYDRRGAGPDVERVHQEDLCQILSIPSSRKYVGDGGPGFPELFASTRQYTRPAAVYQNELIRRMLFNLVIGNNDAHGKNFSFLHIGGNLTLAPAYDLVCTAIYADLNQEFAMPFGGAIRMSELNDKALEQFSRDTDVTLRRQSRELIQFLDKLLEAFAVEANLLERECYPQTNTLIAAMNRLIRHNHGRVRALFTQ
ncbi:MAG: HipA domain-containing protein [Gammaproteobacteria bacterium]|nr:HipA domain-containing protein [Gammaproteobacteria bacterium]